MKEKNALFRIPVATYRLQFNSQFTFDQARSLVPYFEALGITDLYSSPIFTAPPESNHGYDVCNYNQLNPVLGSTGAFDRLARSLKSHQMGVLMDFVPNHMGASLRYNSWWCDVLTRGVGSRFANFFDIDWDPPQAFLKNKVLLPVLEDEYQRVLENHLLSLEMIGGRYHIKYRDMLLPVCPKSYSFIRSEFAGRSKNDVRLLKQLLARQHYVLMFWRTGTRLANYRRFFDVDGLAAVNMDRPEVFRAAHKLVAKLIRAKQITGLRLDHIDGLADPKQYLTRLQALAGSISRNRPLHVTRPFYILVEKILMPGESLRPDWPVAGTTGYEFAAQATGLMIDPKNERLLTRIYDSFTANKMNFDEVVRQSKQVVMGRGLSKEINVLGRLAKRCADCQSTTAGYSTEDLTSAIVSIINWFPRYRTYISPRTKIQAEDEKILNDSIKKARMDDPQIPLPAFSFIKKLLLGRTATAAVFRKRLQQFTGPVMAKSYEDTAFFIYNRLIALNEVGGSPGIFGTSVDAFHQANQLRLQREPAAMLTTSTHDTKMSEDARARIAAISELPEHWKELVKNAAATNRKFKSRVGQKLAPDANDEYRFYQTWLGTRPLEKGNSKERTFYTRRLQQHMVKCLREAKTYTSWDHQNSNWEKAALSFANRVINHSPSGFSRRFERFATRVAELGAINSLSQTLLKFTVPGVPDIYQGNELWQFIVTDPDNRRPVDYMMRRKILESLKKQTPAVLLKEWRTGAIKMFLTQTILRYRRTHPLLFQKGKYLPLKCEGTFKNHCIAFARTNGDQTIVVLAPRLTAPLGFPPVGDCWGTTSLDLKPLRTINLLNLFTKTPVNSEKPKLSELFRDLPFAALVSTQNG